MRNSAVAYLLHLFFEDVDGGLGGDDEIAHNHSHGNKQPLVNARRHHGSQEVAYGHKAHVDARKKQHKSEVSVKKAAYYADKLMLFEAFCNQLEKQEQNSDGRKRDDDFPEVIGKRVDEVPCRVLDGHDVGDDYFRGRDFPGVIDYAQNKHRKNGTDAAQSHRAEAVGPRVLAVFD